MYYIIFGIIVMCLILTTVFALIYASIKDEKLKSAQKAKEAIYQEYFRLKDMQTGGKK